MAAACPPAITFFLCSIFLFQTICTSGAFLDFYDSAQVMVPFSSVITDYRVLVTEKKHTYIFLKPFECRARTCRSEHLAGSFVSEVLVPNQHLNFSNVIVTATTEKQLGALRRTLQSIHDSLGAAGLARSIRVSPELLLSSLRTMTKNPVGKRQWGKVMEFVRKSGSFVQVEMDVEAKGALAVATAMHEAVADFATFSGADDSVVLHFKSGAAPSVAEMDMLVGEISREKRILGLLVDVSSPRRELVAETRATVHDDVTNPVTVPATNPATNPMSPGIVTVPSTNPGMGFASNSNFPPLYPEPTTTPVTMPDPTTTTPTPTTMPSPVTSPVPDMNPVTAPTMPGSVTNPTAPVTNPATTPTTVTNPVTTYPPYPPQGGGWGVGTGGVPTAPVYQPPATMPGGTVQPAAPTVGGQTWCIAKTGLTDKVLQNGIDYACGIGGADCSALQPMGSCYNPNTVQAHASYAFNSYFQRNPSPATCDFGGAGMLVNVNPSSGTCMYQTSAGFSGGTSPGVTGTVPTGYIPGTGPTGTTTGTAMGGGAGSTVMNANNPGGNSMYGGYDSPTSLTTGSASLSCGWVLCLIWMITFAFVKEKV